MKVAVRLQPTDCGRGGVCVAVATLENTPQLSIQQIALVVGNLVAVQ
jgi:hypothetical protein